MVKRTCAMLMRLHDEGIIDTTPLPDSGIEDEV